MPVNAHAGYYRIRISEAEIYIWKLIKSCKPPAVTEQLRNNLSLRRTFQFIYTIRIVVKRLDGKIFSIF